MPRLIAEMPFPYAGRALKPGDEFDASEKDANLLRLTKRAIDAKAERASRAQLDLAGQEAANAGEPQQSRRGRYNRRDMRAGE